MFYICSESDNIIPLSGKIIPDIRLRIKEEYLESIDSSG